jgi:hypothetical protein
VDLHRIRELANFLSCPTASVASEGLPWLVPVLRPFISDFSSWPASTKLPHSRYLFGGNFPNLLPYVPTPRSSAGNCPAPAPGFLGAQPPPSLASSARDASIISQLCASRSPGSISKYFPNAPPAWLRLGVKPMETSDLVHLVTRTELVNFLYFQTIRTKVLNHS